MTILFHFITNIQKFYEKSEMIVHNGICICDLLEIFKTYQFRCAYICLIKASFMDFKYFQLCLSI